MEGTGQRAYAPPPIGNRLGTNGQPYAGGPLACMTTAFICCSLLLVMIRSLR
jgi:hypothetical protein